MSSFLRPRPIAAADNVAAFECGVPSLDDWLRRRALRNEQGGASRTFVSVVQETGDVAGYYCLSASSVKVADAPGALKRNMPDPIPVILIGRLAVAHRFAGNGLGSSLLQNAMLKSMEASRLVGARAVLVHALSADAEAFYRSFGFALVPDSERVMYLLISDAEATVSSLAVADLKQEDALDPNR